MEMKVDEMSDKISRCEIKLSACTQAVISRSDFIVDVMTFSTAIHLVEHDAKIVHQRGVHTGKRLNFVSLH